MTYPKALTQDTLKAAWEKKNDVQVAYMKRQRGLQLVKTCFDVREEIVADI